MTNSMEEHRLWWPEIQQKSVGKKKKRKTLGFFFLKKKQSSDDIKNTWCVENVETCIKFGGETWKLKLVYVEKNME